MFPERSQFCFFAVNLTKRICKRMLFVPFAYIARGLTPAYVKKGLNEVYLLVVKQWKKKIAGGHKN